MTQAPTSLILVSNRGHIWGSGTLWRMAAEPGAPMREIRVEETTWGARPDWARDGRRVVYASYQGRQWHQLWLMTADGDNPFAPDAAVAGPDVEILLRLPGRAELVPLSSVLEDPGGRGIAMRFGGNRENSRRWMSGCIACLYSCPGSKVGNARYTVRDYVKDTTRFRVREGTLPPDGTRIGVVLRLVPKNP